ncbi:O-antigen ligase family protein [Mariprofundus erugo]|nr:O-antigen ligase family protein [Mariprofundus erugo]
MLNQRIESAIFILYGSLFFWLPIPLGGKFPWATSAMEIWIFLLTIATIWMIATRRMAMPATFSHNHTALILISSTTLWILIQIVPLPSSLLSLLSPVAASIPGQDTIALDPNITVLQLQKSLALVLLFALTLLLVHTRERLKWLAYIITASAFLHALFAIVLELSGIQYTVHLYGYSDLDKPVIPTGRAKGFHSNPDHLAGMLEISLAIGIGLLISMLHSHQFSGWRQRIRHISQTILGPKARLRIILMILCIALVMTHSRMGNSAFFISLMISGVLFLLLSRHASRAVSIFIVSLIVLDIVIIGSWVGLQKVVDRIEQTTTTSEAQRGDVYADTLAMTSDFRLSGIGAGNFFSAFPGYKQDGPTYYIDHVHNDYLELLLELGLAGFTPLALLLIYALIRTLITLKQRRSGLILGMSFASLMGIISILIHSTVDFNLQVPSNAALFTVLVAIPFICARLHSEAHGRDT